MQAGGGRAWFGWLLLKQIAPAGYKTFWKFMQQQIWGNLLKTWTFRTAFSCSSPPLTRHYCIRHFHWSMASSSDQGPTAVLSPTHAGSSYSQSPSYQDRFLWLLRQITKLQWVRESLPSHSKYHEALRQKYEKEVNTKTRLERSLYVNSK